MEETNKNDALVAEYILELAALKERVSEIEGDLERIVKTIATSVGEPYVSLLKEIVSKKQGR